ncbi:hypothetical protein PPL_11993 [Heterostelium album PN500]|uniref:Uncharacterized protein n=1 Tax=Heterostelium pallidum (strain ATCC 26659 / Pp 5 / PN500) TaxID=670386 RepID=D3BV21_HETP5|nr:hypothetical protein PPL_11993 [Heterostelium album PN500]EFA74959.1 hypothetical protein PPL_11993 [Heterostelium album PN500]|eukprot:XP_020427093.1 hypothetical protein PPL_11993 [Heterostelium album PN500]
MDSSADYQALQSDEADLGDVSNSNSNNNSSSNNNNNNNNNSNKLYQYDEYDNNNSSSDDVVVDLKMNKDEAQQQPVVVVVVENHNDSKLDTNEIELEQDRYLGSGNNDNSNNKYKKVEEVVEVNGADSNNSILITNNNSNNNNSSIYGQADDGDDASDNDNDRLLEKTYPDSETNSDSDSNSNFNINSSSSILPPLPPQTFTPSKLEQHVTFNDNILKYSSVDPEDFDDDDDTVSSLNESDFVTPDADLFPTPNNIYERILNQASKLRFEASIHAKELKLTAAYLACFISLGISIGSLGPTLPALAKNTHSTLAEVGYFFSARGVGYFIGSFSGRVWLAGLLFFFEGVGGGVTDAGLNTMIVWIWKKSVNPFMQLLHFSFGIGALLAPFIVSMIVESSLFVKYLVLSMIMLCSFLPVILLRSPPPYNEETETAVTLTKNEKRLRIEVILAVACFLFFYVGAEAGYGGWVFTYAKSLLNMEDQAAGLLNSLFWTTFTLARLAGVFISMYLTPNVKMFLFSFLLIIAPYSEAVLWIATSGLGISLASIFPTCISLPQNLNMPVTGEATSYMIIGATLGEVTIPWLIGVAQHHISERTLPWVVVISCVITLAVYIGINIRAKIMRARDRGDTFELKNINQFITTIQHQN